MATSPILAYADASGYVMYPATNVKISPEFMGQLTPLYSQQEIDASMAKFYAAQGLSPTGETLIAPQTVSLEVEAVGIVEAAEQRNASGVELDGRTLAEAALEAIKSTAK